MDLCSWTDSSHDMSMVKPVISAGPTVGQTGVGTGWMISSRTLVGRVLGPWTVEVRVAPLDLTLDPGLDRMVQLVAT